MSFFLSIFFLIYQLQLFLMNFFNIFKRLSFKCLYFFRFYFILFQNKPVLVEPIDFESFVQKNKTLIQNDPQRELLLFPNDDVSEIVLPKKFRTVSSNIPAPPPRELKRSDSSSSTGSSPSHSTPLGGLLTRQALHTYETANHVIHYKFNGYSGSCYEMPK